MKKCLTLSLLLTLLHTVQAQVHPFIDSILENRIVKIPFYEVPIAGAENLILKMTYGQSSFLDTTGIFVLQEAQILSVDLLFSDYPAAANLRTLNKSRLTALCQLLPGIEKQLTITWTIVRQTDGFDKPSAEQLVHGFVINYRRNYTPAEAAKELTLIKAATPPPPPPPPPPDPPAPKEKINHWAIMHRTDSYTSNVYNDQPVKKMSETREKLTPYKRSGDTLIAITAKEAYDKRLLPPGGRYTKTMQDSIFLLLPATRNQYTFKTIVTPKGEPIPEDKPRDSTVLKSLGRNPFDSALVVMDVTGSMAPYIAQLVQWMGKQEAHKTIQYLACFNDGNKLPDQLKQINQTGGIYGEKYVNSQQASALIQKAMKSGNGGGDIQENDCEALLVAMHDAPDCKDLVLIADSWAPIRDTSLIDSIHKPVHIIVCGKRLGIHPDYIRLALTTGGSLHFAGEDLLNLQPLREGKEMLINQRTYYYSKGRVFMKVR
jgi:hypothetical protein